MTKTKIYSSSTSNPPLIIILHNVYTCYALDFSLLRLYKGVYVFFYLFSNKESSKQVSVSVRISILSVTITTVHYPTFTQPFSYFFPLLPW